MPQLDIGVTGVGQVIQLAVAPVFLLSAIGALMMVLTNRLGRVIDRARVVETLVPAVEEGISPALQRELATLSLRARMIYRSITLCVATAVLVCSTIVALFLGAFVEMDVSIMVALLFIGAMLTFLGALLTLMRELFIATSSLHIGRR